MPDRKGDENGAPLSDARVERARRLRQRIADAAGRRDDTPRTPREITDEAAEEERRREEGGIAE